MTTHYIVKTARAQMPASCKGDYRKVAVLEIDATLTDVKMISERAKGVVRIVEVWDRLHAKGVDTAYARALTEAQKMAAELNAKVSQ